MTVRPTSRVNDPKIVRVEYESENRFLARRLTTWAELDGPIVEDDVIDIIGSSPPKRLLDVGSGTGDFTQRLHNDLGVPTIALDLSPRMVALTRDRGLAAVVGDIQRLPFESGAFDCVLANRVLYHLPDVDAGLAEVARVLRRDGMFVAIVYGASHLREVWQLVGEASMQTATTGTPNPTDDDDVVALARHFADAERHELSGRAIFADRAAIEGYLQAFGGFAAHDLTGTLHEVSAPLSATYRHVILVAHKRA